jgi:O-antigen ligase
MWTAAVGVWRQHPLFGVGIDNWGAFAASFYRPGELEGNYFFNPGALYGRSAHNQYVTVLAEQGLVGVAAFAWIFIDFWRRNIAMRSAAAVARWKELGGRLNLRHVALGLEAAVVGWMAAAALYSMRGVHWLYTLLALNLLIHSFVRSATPSSPPAGLAGHRGRPARMPAPHHARLR